MLRFIFQSDLKAKAKQSQYIWIPAVCEPKFICISPHTGTFSLPLINVAYKEFNNNLCLFYTYISHSCSVNTVKLKGFVE